MLCPMSAMSSQLSPDFLHCYRCLASDSHEEVFRLTQCQRIFCRSCLHSNDYVKCCVGCGSAECQSLALVMGRSGGIDEYLTDTKTWMRQLSNAYRFQRSQQMQLFSAMSEKINRLERENSELRRNENQLSNECQLIRFKYENLKSSFKSQPNRQYNPMNVQNAESPANNTHTSDRKPDLSGIFGLRRNEHTSKPIKESLCAHNHGFKDIYTSMADTSDTDSSGCSVRSKQSLHSSQLGKQKPRPRCYSSKYSPMSTSPDSSLSDRTLHSLSPSTLSTLSTISFGIDFLKKCP